MLRPGEHTRDALPAALLASRAGTLRELRALSAALSGAALWVPPRQAAVPGGAGGEKARTGLPFGFPAQSLARSALPCSEASCGCPGPTDRDGVLSGGQSPFQPSSGLCSPRHLSAWTSRSRRIRRLSILPPFLSLGFCVVLSATVPAATAHSVGHLENSYSSVKAPLKRCRFWKPFHGAPTWTDERQRQISRRAPAVLPNGGSSLPWLPGGRAWSPSRYPRKGPRTR